MPTQFFKRLLVSTTNMPFSLSVVCRTADSVVFILFATGKLEITILFNLYSSIFQKFIERLLLIVLLC
jgi:hypothetical protein